MYQYIYIHFIRSQFHNPIRIFIELIFLFKMRSESSSSVSDAGEDAEIVCFRDAKITNIGRLGFASVTL